MTNKPAVSPSGVSRNGSEAEDALPSQLRLWKFMTGHTARYVSGESTSVPQETADELLSSALYAMGLAPEDPELWEHLPQDLDAAYRAGVRRLERKVALGKSLCTAAIRSVPNLPCQSLADTLKSIRQGFKIYDFHWLAREFPADIDYQLCLGVPETLAGVDYVNEYLRRILIENDFLRRTDTPACEGILNRMLPNWKALVCSLYEPAAAGALGAAMTGRPISLLRTDVSTLQSLLKALPRSRIESELDLAAERAANALNIQNAAARRYLTETADTLVPRISAALDNGNLEGIFPDF